MKMMKMRVTKMKMTKMKKANIGRILASYSNTKELKFG